MVANESHSWVIRSMSLQGVTDVAKDWCNCDDEIVSNSDKSEWVHFRMLNGKPIMTQKCYFDECQNPNPRKKIVSEKKDP